VERIFTRVNARCDSQRERLHPQHERTLTSRRKPFRTLVFAAHRKIAHAFAQLRQLRPRTGRLPVQQTPLHP
jgi:hypothetical protein